MPAKLQRGITTTDCPVERVAKMKPTFVEENTRELQRLRALVNQLTDLDSKLTVGDSWTVSALLARLAFWDYRALVLLNRWKKVDIGSSPIGIDGVNDATLPLCLAIPLALQRISPYLR